MKPKPDITEKDRAERQRRIVAATRDFLSIKRPERQGAGKKAKVPAKQQTFLDDRQT